MSESSQTGSLNDRFSNGLWDTCESAFFALPGAVHRNTTIDHTATNGHASSQGYGGLTHLEVSTHMETPVDQAGGTAGHACQGSRPVLPGRASACEVSSSINGGSWALEALTSRPSNVESNVAHADLLRAVSGASAHLHVMPGQMGDVGSATRQARGGRMLSGKASGFEVEEEATGQRLGGKGFSRTQSSTDRENGALMRQPLAAGEKLPLPGREPAHREGGPLARQPSAAAEKEALLSQAPEGFEEVAGGVGSGWTGSVKASTARVCEGVWGSGGAGILLSAAVQAISALCVKQMEGRVPVTQIVLVRSIICFMMTVPISRAGNVRPLFGARRAWGALAARAVVGTSAMSMYYVAVQHLPLADAMTIFLSNPAMTALLSWLFRGEPLSLVSCGGIGASLAGVTLVTHPPFLFGGHADWDQGRLIGVVMGIASSTCSAFAYILISLIPKDVPALVVALWFHCSGVVMAVPLAVGYPEKAVTPAWIDTLRLVGVGTTSFAVQLLINRAFRLESASKMATMGLTQVVYGHVLGVLLLGDRESIMSILGTGLIAVGVATVSFNSRKPAPPQPEEEVLPIHASYWDSKSDETSKRGSWQATSGVLAPLWAGADTGGQHGHESSAGEDESLLLPRQRSFDPAHLEAARVPISF